MKKSHPLIPLSRMAVLALLLQTLPLSALTVINNFDGTGNNGLQTSNYGTAFAGGTFSIAGGFWDASVTGMAGNSGAFWNIPTLDVSAETHVEIDFRAIAPGNLSSGFQFLIGDQTGNLNGYNFNLPAGVGEGGTLTTLSIDLTAPDAVLGLVNFSSVDQYQIKNVDPTNDMVLDIAEIRLTGSVVPEPSTYALMAGCAVLALALLKRRRATS